MKKTSLLISVFIFSLLLLPLGTVMGDGGDNGDGGSFFHIGNLTMTREGEITGTYIPRVLEGVTLSIYSDTGKHVMDILYGSSRIEVYIELFDDALVRTLWERGILERNNLFKITFTGQPQMSFTYENCTVELQDTSISFLRVTTPGQIVFSNLSRYTLHKQSPTIVTLTNDDFYGTVTGSKELILQDDGLITQKSVIFRGMDLYPNGDIQTEKILTVEDAILYGELGGEITLVKKGGALEWISTTYANNVSLWVDSETTTSTKTQLVVAGDEQGAGKTIKVNIGQNVLSPQDLEVRFDGQKIPLADNLTDVLNPNDDGLQPEYVMVEISGGKDHEFFLLVSVPHFSEHFITLESLQENPFMVGLSLVSAFTVIALATWVVIKR